MPDTKTTERSDIDLINNLRTLYQLARDDKRSRYDTWRRNYRLVHNRTAYKTFNSNNVSPAPKDSEIYPILSSRIGWMTDQRTNVDFSPACDPYTSTYDRYTELCTDLKAITESIWYSEFLDAEIKLMLWDASQFQNGYLKVVWDQALAGGMGQAVFRRVDPYNIYVDPNATSFKDAEYIVEAKRMSLDEIERRWPGTSTTVEASAMLGEVDDRPNQSGNQSSIPKANPGSLPSGNGNWGRAKANFNPGYDPLQTVVVYEFWLKENAEWYTDPTDPEEAGNKRPPNEFPTAIPDKFVEARWRVIVLAAGQILMDEYADDLYSNGQPPYVRYTDEDTGEFYGVALCDHLADPQIYINRLLATLQQNAELVGNPIFIESSNSGLDRTTIINKPGQRLRLNGTGAMANPPFWLSPPNMPSGIRELIEFWINRMENISGLSSVGKGGEPLARTTNDVVNAAQESSFVRVRSSLRNLEATLCEAVQLMADLIIDNYTEPRIIGLLGEEGAKGAKLLNYRHFWVGNDEDAEPLKYAITIQGGSAMPTSRQARVSEADLGFAMGTVDRIGWYQAHQFPNWQEMNKRIEDQMAKGLFEPPGARARTKRTS